METSKRKIDETNAHEKKRPTPEKAQPRENPLVTLEFLDGDAIGFCDAETGICALPGTSIHTVEPSDQTRNDQASKPAVPTKEAKG